MNDTFLWLADALPSLRNKGAPLPSVTPRDTPWNAGPFLDWQCSQGLSHGEELAGRFLLGVWNPDTDWVAMAQQRKLRNPQAARRFDVLEAASVWDSAHLKVLSRWVTMENRFP